MVTAAEEDLHTRLAVLSRADAQAYLEMLQEQGPPSAPGTDVLNASQLSSERAAAGKGTDIEAGSGGSASGSACLALSHARLVQIDRALFAPSDGSLPGLAC